MSSSQPSAFVSKRFLKKERGASPPLAMLARQEVAHLLQVRAASRTWLGEYDQLTHLRPGTVLEMDLGGGARMLTHAGPGGDVTVLGMGSHGWFHDYTPTMLAKDLAGRQPLPDRFRPGAPRPNFASTGTHASVWGNETRPEWLYFLDEQQLRTSDVIVADVEDALLGCGSGVHFLVGGPGTGKTSVLLQLLLRLTDAVVENRETWDVRLDVSDRLAEFIGASTGWDLDAVRRPVDEADPADVVLVDDPASTYAIRGYTNLLAQGHLKALVVGFDPQQLVDSLQDSTYRALVTTVGARTHHLDNSYRQKAVVGRLTKEVAESVAQSSPFLAADKKQKYAREREEVTALGNALTFPNPGGRVTTHEDAGLTDWKRHLSWLRSQPLWDHWAPLLIVTDDWVTVPPAWNRALGGVRHDVVSLRDSEVIKGLEYQHVALLLTPGRWRTLRDGFSGSGRAAYQDYRLARIPFSRAKDSIAVLVSDHFVRAVA